MVFCAIWQSSYEIDNSKGLKRLDSTSILKYIDNSTLTKSVWMAWQQYQVGLSDKQSLNAGGKHCKSAG
jgi:hypothetical protein